MTATIQEVTTENIKSKEPLNVLRTRRSGVWEVYDGPWGSYLRMTDDPEANVEITEDHLKKFELKENIHKIPPELWSRWVKLCFYFVDKVPDSVEVSIRILRKEDNPSEYRFLVPEQKVSGASVRVDNFDKAIDIETGEEIEQYPPAGWIPVGSSHSHNTMQAFFSGIDDKYELDDPGIHLVIGSIDTKNMKYTIASSVVGSRRRFEVSYDKLVDATPVEGITFHPKVLDYVDWTTPTQFLNKNTKTSLITVPTKWTKKESKSTKSKFDSMEHWGWSSDDNYSDPFYWNSSFFDGTDEVNGSEIKIWHIFDAINDFTSTNYNNLSRLMSLKDELYDAISDLEVVIDSQIEKDSEEVIETAIY